MDYEIIIYIWNPENNEFEELAELNINNKSALDIDTNEKIYNLIRKKEEKEEKEEKDNFNKRIDEIIEFLNDEGRIYDNNDSEYTILTENYYIFESKILGKNINFFINMRIDNLFYYKKSIKSEINYKNILKKIFL